MTRESHEIQGVCEALGELGSGATVTENALAQLMGRHVVSIKRAVERSELPPPVRLLGKRVWTVGHLVEHLNNRLKRKAQEVEKSKRYFEELRA